MDPAVSLAAVAIEHDINPNVLRRWVIEHKRLGLHDADAPTDGASVHENFGDFLFSGVHPWGHMG
jgi:transposase-like protein